MYNLCANQTSFLLFVRFLAAAFWISTAVGFDLEGCVDNKEMVFINIAIFGSNMDVMKTQRWS